MLKCGFFVLGTESDCTIGYVKCGNQVDCIYARLICDGTQQCPDGSDEDKAAYIYITTITAQHAIPLVHLKS
jgi:hypothetical protein